jgi:hypothetical protein
MELIYKNPGIKYMVDGIMMFQINENSEYWREPLFRAYPQIDKNHFNSLNTEERKEYIYDVMQKVYENEKAVISNKLIKYNQHWENNRKQIEESFSKAFQIECQCKFNNMVGNINLNPIEPRWLDSFSFDVFYRNNEKDALGTALHEIVHFVWFYIWQKHFNDNKQEYETPHLKWIFSEMVVDPIIRNDCELKKMIPNFDDGCAYSYFYKMRINGNPILETLYLMYKRLNILDFMEQGYEYCIKNEVAIRNQMK